MAPYKEKPATSVAFIGTGLMGYPMAKRLLLAGLPVVAWNRHLEKARGLESHGATLAQTPEEALVLSQVVMLMLADAPAIEATLFASIPQALTGKTILQMGTIAPEESQALAQRVESLGGNYLEAPVLGSVPQAETGELAIMVGGQEPLFKLWEHLLAHLGTPRYIGRVGTASALKLALNNLIAAQGAAFATSLAMVQKSQVRLELFLEILRQSAFYAPSFDRKLPVMLSPSQAGVNFPVRHMLKDVQLIRRTANKLGIDTTLVEALENLFAKTQDQGLPDKDYAAVAVVIAREN